MIGSHSFHSQLASIQTVPLPEIPSIMGKSKGREKLKKDIRAKLDENLLDAFHGTVSLSFEASENQKVAVKIVDDRGIESLKIVNLEWRSC